MANLVPNREMHVSDLNPCRITCLCTRNSPWKGFVLGHCPSYSSIPPRLDGSHSVLECLCTRNSSWSSWRHSTRVVQSREFRFLSIAKLPQWAECDVKHFSLTHLLWPMNYCIYLQSSFTSLSAGIDFRRQIMTSKIDPRIEHWKSRIFTTNVNPSHRYSNEVERSNQNIYNDFKLKKTPLVNTLSKTVNPHEFHIFACIVFNCVYLRQLSVTKSLMINPYSAGIDFSRQNLTSIDDVYRRQILMLIPALRVKYL